jgi:hypothetical protein
MERSWSNVDLVRVLGLVRVTIFLLHAEAVVNNSSIDVLMPH